MKRFLALIIVVPLVLCVSCSRENPAPKSPGITPRKIVSLSPGTTEILFALGLDSEIAGVTNFCDYPPAAVSKPKVGGLYDLNFESILELNPELVIMTPPLAETGKELERLGFRTLVVRNEKFADVIQSITEIGAAVGRPEEADKLAAEMKAEFETARANLPPGPPVRTMIVVDRNPGTMQGIYVAGRNTYFTEILDITGGKNIFDDAPVTYPEPSLEEIIARNPQVIIETRLGEKYDDDDMARVADDWKSLGDIDAVVNGRVYIWTEDFVARPGPRFVLLLRKFRKVMNESR